MASEQGDGDFASIGIEVAGDVGALLGDDVGLPLLLLPAGVAHCEKPPEA